MRHFMVSAVILAFLGCSEAGPEEDDAPGSGAGGEAAPSDADTDDDGSEDGAGETATTGSAAGQGGSQTTPDEPTRIVLLVPGTMITGDYFDDMAERLSADGFLPVIYEPPDLLTESLVSGASGISDEIDRVLAASGAQKLHIVAECNGGVATRYLLQVLGGTERVDQFISFVSAHHGTWLSPVGDLTTGFTSLAEITPGSAFLAELNAAPFPSGLHMTSIYSCNDELMLPYDTSAVSGATNVLFCDHYLGHLDGFWDSLVYERIRVTLEGQGDAAPTSY